MATPSVIDSWHEGFIRRNRRALEKMASTPVSCAKQCTCETQKFVAPFDYNINHQTIKYNKPTDFSKPERILDHALRVGTSDHVMFIVPEPFNGSVFNPQHFDHMLKDVLKRGV